MPLFSVKAYTGPAYAELWAQEFRQRGYRAHAGTEHVYVEMDGLGHEGAAWNAQVECQHKLTFKPCSFDFSYVE